ncbi:MAG: type II secretion system F family protein [Planctomycetes bacterium]|nr:type II secretion system F family protein [Planctomycetota bacterium]
MSLEAGILIQGGVVLPFVFVALAVWWRMRLFRQALFFRHLAVMLRLGAPIRHALSAADEGAHLLPPHVMHPIREGIERGERFSDLLSRHSKPFEARHLRLVAAGEKSGTLAAACAGAGRFPSPTVSLGTQLLLMLAYLSLLASLAGTYSGWFGVFVLPMFRKVGEAGGGSLAAPLRLYALSQWVIVTAIVLHGFLLVAFILARRPLRSAILSRFLFRVPGLGGHLADSACLLIVRGLGVLRSARLASREVALLLPTLATQAGMSFRLKAVSEMVLAGRSLSRSLHEGRFPDSLVHFTEMAENGAGGETVLMEAEHVYESRMERRVFLLQRIVLPAFIATIGMGVGLMALSLFLSLQEITLAFNS